MTQSRYWNTTGIIYRLLDAKEADLVIYMLTASGEKLAAVVPGVRKGTSRKAHAVDLFNLVEAKFSKGKGNLDTITELKLLDRASGFKSNFELLMLSQLICELINMLSQESHPEPAYFRNLLNLMEVKAPERPVLLAAALILRCLYINGTLPGLTTDVANGEEMTATDPRFATSEIGYTANPGHGTSQVSDRLYRVQKFILSHSFSQIDKIDLKSAEQIELFNLHLQWLQFATDRTLKSAELFLGAL